VIGRWLTPDPITGIAPRSLNPYYYCYANPTTYVDPTGQWVWVIPLALGLYGAYMGYRARGWGGALIGFNMGAIAGGILVIGAEWAPIAGGGIGPTIGNAIIGTMFIDVSTQLLISNEVNWEQALAAGLSGGASALVTYFIKPYIERIIYRYFYYPRIKYIVDRKKLIDIVSKCDKAPKLYTLLIAGGTIIALSVGWRVYEENWGNPWQKIMNIFNLDEWVTGKEGGGGGMIGWLDLKHVLLGTSLGGAFRATGISRNVAIAYTVVGLFLLFESVGETSIPWEYGDFYSDIYGVMGAYK
jgi:hypothetical protein